MVRMLLIKCVYKRCLSIAGLCLAMLLSACGGGVGEDGTGGPISTSTIGTVSGLGSGTVHIDGIGFDLKSARVIDGFGEPLNAEMLRLGMWVSISGLIDESGQRGVAQEIQVRPAVRGVVVGTDPAAQTLNLLGSTARYSSGTTVVDGTSSAQALKPGDLVEVHGALEDSQGNVQATRLELLEPSSPAAQQQVLRGRVRGLDRTAQSFLIGQQRVSYGSAAVTLRQPIANGMMVRVASARAPALGQPWLIERLTTDQPLPANLGFIYVEGVTSEWTPTPTFVLEGLFVNASQATGPGNGTSDGQRVAVIGRLRDGQVLARAVTEIRPGTATEFTLTGPVASFNALTQFRVRGVVVDASAARFVNGQGSALGDGVRVQVIGTLAGQRLKARRVVLLP